MTGITLLQWLFITGVGRFPAIVLSTLGGDALEAGNLGIFILMLVIIAVLSVGGLAYYRKINGDQSLREEISARIMKIRERLSRNRGE